MQYSCIPCSPDPGNTNPQGWLLVWCTGRAAGEAQIRRNDEHILIPVTGKPEPDELAVLPGAGENIAIFEAEFEPKRKRVADMVKPGQYVVDLFAGVGPFSILIGKSVPGASVMAVEDDAKHAAGNVKHSADHVIMNLPHFAREFLDCNMLAVKNGGVVHFYDITHEDDLYGTSWGIMQEAAVRVGRKVECTRRRIVRSYAPYQYNVCIEFMLTC